MAPAPVLTVTRVVTRVVEFPRGPRGHFCHFEFLLQLLKKTKRDNVARPISNLGP